MRNTLQYPITSEEKLNLIFDLKAELEAERDGASLRLGDMRPLLLDRILSDLQILYYILNYEDIQTSFGLDNI